VIPPEHNGEYVARMEDVLDVYERPRDLAAPVVCMDEMPVQLLKETRVPIPAKPGHPRRIDYEYERNGTANIFMFAEPLAGWRQTLVTDRRTAVDWAIALRDLVDSRYPDARVIVLIMDNLNTHTLGSLYEAFPPAEARRVAKRLEIHHTPKHGSWLNMAENELSALSRQCLARRIGKIEDLRREVEAWDATRNTDQVQIHWRFTLDQARIKLRNVYPVIQD
jgi:DDE superfamily endonuclease